MLEAVHGDGDGDGDGDGGADGRGEISRGGGGGRRGREEEQHGRWLCSARWLACVDAAYRPSLVTVAGLCGGGVRAWFLGLVHGDSAG